MAKNLSQFHTKLTWQNSAQAAVFLALLFSTQISSGQAAKSSTQESDESMGLTEAEMNAMDKSARDFAKKFKDGRKSFAEDPKSRNAEVIEMHDHDGNALTDHPEGSILESKTSAASGIDKFKFGQEKERAEAIKKWRDKKVNECEEKLNKQFQSNPDQFKGQDFAEVQKAVCYQPSPNLENVGSAHGGENETHRNYVMKDAVKKASREAGEAYANRVWNEAGNYEGVEQFKKSKNASKVMVKTLKDGRETFEEVDRGVNPDLIQSEVAHLEEKVDENVLQNFKLFRGRRLAKLEFEDDADFDATVSEAYKGTSKEDIERGDNIVALKVAEKEVVGNKDFCWTGNTPKKVPDSGVCEPGSEKLSLAGHAKKLAEAPNAKPLSSDDKNKMREAAFNALDNKEKEAAKKKLADIKKCMGQNTWCDKEFKEQKGDPGGLYKDTREYNYNVVSLGRKKGLNQYEKDMEGNIDYNKNPDYKEFQKQMKDAKSEYASFLKDEKDKEAFSKKNGGNYKSPYLNKKNFDLDKMNTRQLSGRNPKRGDATFSSTPYAGKVIRMPGNSGGSLAGGGFQPPPVRPPVSPIAAPPPSTSLLQGGI